MTSVPKPLKFLRPHYETIKQFYTEQPASDFKKSLADLISVLGITMSEPGSNESLRFALEGSHADLTTWGSEYLRALSGEISSDYQRRLDAGEPTDELGWLIDTIVPYNMAHNAEPEAIDLLMEVEQLPKLIPHCTQQNFEKVALYLRSSAQYAADPEEQEATLITCFEVYAAMKRYPEALLLAQKVNQNKLIESMMTECKDPTTLKQLAFIIGRQRSPYESADEELQQIISYERLSEHFKALARELDVVEPKTPD